MDAKDYKIGDVVRIRYEKDIPNDCTFGWVSNMGKFSGKTYTISGIRDTRAGNTRYFFEDMSDDMDSYWWSDDMFELVSPVPSINEEEWQQIMNSGGAL